MFKKLPKPRNLELHTLNHFEKFTKGMSIITEYTSGTHISHM